VQRSLSRSLLLAAAALLCLAGCRPSGEAPRGASSGEPPGPEELFRLRNAALLEAARDTPEGYLVAAAAYERCLRAGETTDDLLNLARVSFLGERWAEAERALARLRRALGAAPPPPDVLYLEGLIFRATRRFSQATASFRALVELAPREAAVWYQLGNAHFLAREYAAAASAFEKLLELDPDHKAGLYKIGRAFRALGRDEDYERWNAAFLELENSPRNPGNVEEKHYERCGYTRVSLIPAPRSEAEPPPIALAFEPGPALPLAAGAPAAGGLFFDMDGDRDLDLYLFRRGPNLLLRNDAGSFTDVSELSDAEDTGEALLALAADVDNDGILDLFLANRSGPASLLRGMGEGTYQPLGDAGLGIEGVVAARWLDYDHDGDLDLAVLTTAPDLAGRLQPELARNNGDATFTLQEGLLAGTLAASDAHAQPAMADLDSANDIDLVFPDPAGPAVAYLNLRRGPFRRLEIPGLEGHAAVLAADLDNDGDMDLIGAPRDGVPLRVAWNDGAEQAGVLRPFRVTAPEGLEEAIAGALQLLLADLDDDGDLDLLVVGAQGIALLANRRGGALEAVPLGIDAPPLRSAAAADIDGDGRLDLLLIGDDGRTWLQLNRGGPRHGAVRLRLAGGRDNRDGIGAHVELFAGRRYQRLCVERPGGPRFGLGSAALDEIDGFAVLWPNGIRQAVLPGELAWDERRETQVVQKAGLTVSCPFLYTHDGRGYRFLTDVVAIAPLDEWIPEGGTPHLDPEEYVRIPGSLLAPLGGRLRAAITEELRETAYLDRVRLIRVSHPRGTTLHNDESTRQGGVTPLEVFVLDDATLSPPAAVRAGGCPEALELVRALDRRYLHAYEEGPSQWAGWVAPFAIEIDLPESAVSPPSAAASGLSLCLLLTGRIAWQDSGVAYSLHQHGRAWSSHRLEALAADGSVTPLLDDAGFPCGMDRTLVAPLEEEVARRARSLRLTATSRLFWDRIAFGRAAAVVLPEFGETRVMLAGREARLRSAVLPLLSARLGYHGFSAVLGDAARHEQVYDYGRAGPWRDFPRPVGHATRYGLVTELLDEPDDRLVVMAPGDGLWLEFDAGAPPADGEEVTYFLLLTGWAKESGFHNRTGRTIEPLPFGAMESYPPAAAPPGGAAYENYLNTYQTRRIEE
jgi:tetratricopeptide (TPR) repeat protein